MEQIKWFDRKFDFSSNQNIMPSIVERLEGTPVRLREKMKHINPSVYIIKPDSNWSILEHIGHLSDLEPLWQLRFDDIMNGQKELSPADLDNKKTTNANHNNKSLSELLTEFDYLRQITLSKLKVLKEEDIFKTSIHPRLKIPMRMIDLFTFVAEHDDHHLAKITEIKRIL